MKAKQKTKRETGGAEQSPHAMEIKTYDLKCAALIYRAINHKFRTALLRTLHQKPMITVTEIGSKFQKSQSQISQHLAILRRAQLVVTRRDWKQVYYTVNYDRLQQLHDTLPKLSEGMRS